MSKGPRRDRAPASKAKEALDALKGKGLLNKWDLPIKIKA